MLRDGEAIAKQMDSQGYYALWMAEHHFQREGYECIPNLLMLSTYLSTQTKRLKFGCAFNIVPMCTHCGWPRTSRWRTSYRGAG